MFLKHIQNHCGSLIRLPTELFWYGRGWDRTPGRLCLLLDAATTAYADAYAADASHPAAYAAAAHAASPATVNVVIRLLIDGQMHWVWVAEEDVEFL